MASLSELTASTRRLALVGLAKNTGKTVALTALLRELAEQGRSVGVTSVGRDGEARDVIDRRIEKPSIVLAKGSLVATTDSLLRESGLAHDLLERPDVRTPLGRVLIARLKEPGAIEVAGPSAAADVRAVSDAMLAHGAGQVLIDGAVDRRAASSPDVSDGLIMATGAVLAEDMGGVVEQTRNAVEVVRLQRAPETPYTPVTLPPRFALTADETQIAELLKANPGASRLIAAGAVPEAFLGALVRIARRRGRGRNLTIVAHDSTRFFLSDHGPDWYRDQGVDITVEHPTALLAIAVNPVAPQSHRFDSAQLRSQLREAIPDTPFLDVLDPAYAAAGTRAR
jgi:hypothetical protein